MAFPIDGASRPHNYARCLETRLSKLANEQRGADYNSVTSNIRKTRVIRAGDLQTDGPLHGLESEFNLLV